MNNKLNNNFSLRKLLLTALVAGPLATLPAPLWALPDTASTNLTTSAGVTTQVVGSTLNVTSPDKAVLTWQAFGSGASTINNNEVINYFLPSASSSVLNSVSGGAATTISGSIISNGNVYVLNPAGIVINQTAQVNTGGFYASTVAEPSGFFGINGTLSFAGTSTANVTVLGTGTTSGTDAATIQAVGSGNNIYLAGNAVDIQGGKFFGNLFVRSSNTAVVGPLGGASTAIGFTGPVSVNLVGTPLVGGGLNITTNGGNVSLTGSTGGTLTVAPAVSSSTGAVSINTSGSSVNGTITQGTAAFTANTTGTVVTLNSGSGTTAGNITLGAVDFQTVGATGNTITLNDTAGGVTLAATTAATNLSVTSAAGIAQTTGSTHSVGGTIALAPTASNTVSFTGTGNLTFASIGTTSTLTIVSTGDITLPNVTTTTSMSVTSSGGQITAGTLSASQTLTLSATSSAGNISSSGVIQSGSNFALTTAGNISVTTRLQGGNNSHVATATNGAITLGALTTSSTATITANTGGITVTGTVTNSGNPLTLNSTNGTVSTGAIAGTNSLTVSAGTISTGNISTSSNTTLTASTGTITTGNISTSSTLSLSAPASTGTITTGTLLSTTTRTVTLSSGGTVDLKTTTVPVLSVISTAGSITQSGVITSTSSATFNALADITLTNTGNDFATAVLIGGGGGSTGVQLTDKNDVVIGGGTATLGATTINSGFTGSVAAFTSAPTVTIASNVITATSTATINTTSRSLATLPVTVAGAGYLAVPTVTITGGGATTQATATATINTTTGVVSGYTITSPGVGYTSVPTVTVSAPTGTAPTAVAATLSGGATGMITGVTFTAGTAPFPTAPAVTITGGGGAGAIASSAINATTGALTSVTPLQSTSISLGGAAVDTLSFGSTLTLNTSGLAGSNGATQYSQITTPANNVRVFGNVSINTNGTNATLGNNVFGNAANYSFGQINASVGAGALSIFESQTINLGTITAASLDARSIAANIVNTGKLTVTGNAIFAANSIFSPGDVSLSNTSNALSGTVLIGNANTFSLTNTVNTTVTAGTALVNGKAVAGATNITVTGAGNTLTMNTGVGGDYGTVGFSAAGAVSITDPNGFTLQNATNSGTGTVTLSAAGPIVLGSGIALGSTGATNVTSTGASAAISDSAPNVRIFGPANFTSDNSISITNSGHSLGAVGLVTTAANGATGTSNIAYTEGGTANLSTVSVGSAAFPGSLTVVSTGGSVQQAALGTITALSGVAASNVSFTSNNGSVTLGNTGNSFTSAVAISAVGNSSINVSTATPLILNNVVVSGGIFSASATGAANTIAQVAGSTARIFGNASFTTSGGKITLTNTGNNFGGVTLDSTTGAAAAGADVAITEAGTLNFLSVKAGTTGKLAATSENASIVQSGTTGLIVGGTTALTASAAGINLNTATTSNNFGGSGITITTAGNVSIQDANVTTTIAGGTTVGGTLTVKNTQGTGRIQDSPGNLTVNGNVLFDTTTNAASSVSIGSSNATMGAIQFRSGSVTIVENATVNIAAGSVASGAVSLTSSGNIVTSGSGGGTFQSTLALNASGSITITNPIFVNGAAGSGLTFRSLGAVDLSALSLAGNLNSIAPTNLGASSYKAPSP